MKKIIDREYIRDNVAQLMLGTADNEIVMEGKEILLLKANGKVLINKYLNHPKRREFPYCEVPMHESEGTELYNVLFEMGKNYLVYELGDLNDNVIMNSFTPVSDGCLWNHEIANMPDEDDFESTSYTREEMERIFDGHNYDSLIIADKTGKIMVAYFESDGEIIKTDMLPPREVEMEHRGKSALIYGGFIMQHIMITVKNGVFKAVNFSLTLDVDGTYLLVTQDIVLPDVSFVENLNVPRENYEKTGSVSIK